METGNRQANERVSERAGERVKEGVREVEMQQASGLASE